MTDTLFVDKGKAGGLWNLNDLPNPLAQLPVIPGINTPYLYLGTRGSSFAWHLEDVSVTV